MRNWESIIAAKSVEAFVIIILADNKKIIISKKHFPLNIKPADFIALIQSKITNQNITAEQRYQNPALTYSLKPKPSYWPGLLGFIPIVGLFAGIVFLINGIFKYRDKWLISIGVGCILFTIIFFYRQMHDPLITEGFAKISQIQLNSLVKEIEFYKIQNGAYPDSLEQLDIKDSFTNITDPLLNGKKQDKYFYHRIGNKYTLFSSGVDATSNTADDIYPTIDTSKIGLIINKR